MYSFIHIVKERTKDLTLAHAQIKEILDNLDDVVLTITPDLKIGETYSPASLRILGVDSVANKDIREVLFVSLDKHDEKESRHLFAIETLSSFSEFQWSVSVDDLLKVMTMKMNDKEKTLAIRYSPIFLNDEIQKVVIVVSDITEILTLRASLAAKEEKENFTAAEAIIMLRELHTLKGSARSVGLKYFAKQVHLLEDNFEYIRDSVTKEESECPLLDVEQLSGILKLYFECKEVYTTLIEKNRDSHPAKQALQYVEHFLACKENNIQNILHWIDYFRQEKFFSLNELYLSFQESINEIAKNLEKKISMDIPQWDVFFDISFRAVLGEAFTHTLRNAIDHAIELPEERVQKGKTEFGHIRLEIVPEENFSILKVIDDGRGVNTKKVYEIAQSKNLVTKSFEDMSESEIIDLLFAPGFSTKTGITELSGRGVGLDAVRSSCGALGIQCKIISTIGLGSVFELRIPNELCLYKVSEKFELK